MKIVFFGTSDFGLNTLSALVEMHSRRTATIEAIYTAHPQPSGRGMKVFQSPIHDLAKQLNLVEIVRAPKSLRNNAAEIEFLERLRPDLCVVVSYGLILPEQIIKIPKFGCINVHPSSLPLFRGAAPIERTIESGADNIDVCLMKMTPRLDDGDVLLRKNISIEGLYAAQVSQMCAKIGSELVLSFVEHLIKFQKLMVCEKQNDSIATYANKIQKEELLLNFHEDVVLLFNKIRAFSAKGGCFFFENGKRIKVFEARVLSDNASSDNGSSNDLPSALSDGVGLFKQFGGFVGVKCKNGYLLITKFQKEGGKVLCGTLFKGVVAN